MEAQPLNDGPGVRVSMFDYSVENHLRAINKISKLCGEPENDGLDECDIRRLSSSITFIREWRHFSYEPRIVKFASESERSKEKYVSSEVNLLQFSSATVPKKEEPYDGTTSAKFCKDFIMYVGGSVWALDWCPRVHENPDSYIKCEFIAVAAHPPESYYHKIGAPLIGRGIIQIWCMLNIGGKEEEAPPLKKKQKRKSDNNEGTEGNAMEVKKPRGRPRRHPVDETKDASSEVKKPRGRPKKKPIDESLNNVACENQSVQPLDVEFTEGSFQPPAVEGVPRNTEENAPTKSMNKNKKGKAETASASKAATRTLVRCKRLKGKARAKSYDDDNSLLSLNQSFGASIPKDIALPRVVLCLAHNGKVVWDVKWQPYNVNDFKCKQRMGYLAVLLGNGSLEVWEVPLPHTMGVIYSSSQKDGTDPRFVKLEPVFRCSKLKCGDVQSIPLTVEWSTSPPHDYLLAGCHDGMVALWKFSPSGSPKDTKPVLSFSADTVPIRSVAWAPSFSEPESSNVIVTAGHRGLKFWDIRDPFHPLWDCHPHPRFIYSLDWLSDPRCVLLSFDDGSMRMLSLAQAANDVPVTGKAFTATKQQGLNSIFTGSSFAIWSVQVSRLTGLVAYCSAEGTAICFQLQITLFSRCIRTWFLPSLLSSHPNDLEAWTQLTAKAVDRYFSRNRAPHFLCGSLTEEGSTITINTPLPNVPLPFKKSISDSWESPKSLRSFLTESKQIKRANDKKVKGSSANEHTLALCHDNDPGVESESEGALAALTNKKKPKSKSSNKNKAENNQALAIRSKDMIVAESQENGTGEAVNHDVEALPPKILAMHRVRWNMNKGSERWLCYGGAAGIVRCQQILVPIVGKKSTWKR